MTSLDYWQVKRAAYIEKFNPYHDELGRFTTPGAAASTGKMTPEQRKSPSNMAAQTAIHGGFTFNQKRDQFRSSGMAVSPFKGLEVKYSLDEWAKDGPKHIKKFLKDNAKTLTLPNAHIGGWIDDDIEPVMVFLDVSVVYNSHERAAREARDNDQIAYYNLSTFTEYRRKGDQKYYSYDGDKGGFLDPNEIGKKAPTKRGVYYITPEALKDPKSLALFVKAVAESAIVSKFNPNHDELGQFTTADSAKSELSDDEIRNVLYEASSVEGAFKAIAEKLGKNMEAQVANLSTDEINMYRGSRNTEQDVKNLTDGSIRYTEFQTWGQGIYVSPDTSFAKNYGTVIGLNLSDSANIMRGESEWEDGFLIEWDNPNARVPGSATSPLVDVDKVTMPHSPSDLRNIYYAGKGFDGFQPFPYETVLFNGGSLTVDSKSAGISKFNPNHDELGRFTSADGAITYSRGGITLSDQTFFPVQIKDLFNENLTFADDQDQRDWLDNGAQEIFGAKIAFGDEVLTVKASTSGPLGYGMMLTGTLVNSDGRQVAVLGATLHSVGRSIPEPYLSVSTFFLDGDYQKKGVATTLLAHWEDQLKRSGIEKIHIGASSGGDMNGAYTWFVLGFTPDHPDKVLRHFFNEYPSERRKDWGADYDVFGGNDETPVAIALDTYESEHGADLWPMMESPEFVHFLKTEAGWNGSKDLSYLNPSELSKQAELSQQLKATIAVCNKWMRENPVGLENDDPKFFEEIKAARNEISKYNPYHDLKGRFTDASQALSVLSRNEPATTLEEANKQEQRLFRIGSKKQKEVYNRHVRSTEPPPRPWEDPKDDRQLRRHNRGMRGAIRHGYTPFKKPLSPVATRRLSNAAKQLPSFLPKTLRVRGNGSVVFSVSQSPRDKYSLDYDYGDGGYILRHRKTHEIKPDGIGDVPLPFWVTFPIQRTAEAALAQISD